MKAMQLSVAAPIEQSPLGLVDLPVPEPSPGQVRLRVTVCGACHTDLHTVEGDIHPPALPRVPGHQIVARVDALGAGAESHVGLGARVGVPWLHSTCEACDFCRREQQNLCPDARFTGFHVDGGYAEYLLAEARFVLPLPDGVSDEQAAPLLCAGIIGYRSLHRADVEPGERVGLFGFGASAHIAIQVARHWDCEVFVFTRSEAHREHARELGAKWAGGAEDSAPAPLDRAVIFAPAGTIVPLALDKLRPGGTLAINAIHMSPIPEIDYARELFGERVLRSVTANTREDGLGLLREAAAVPIRPQVESFALEEANDALIALKSDRVRGSAVLRVS